MQTRFTGLMAAILIVMLGMTIGSGKAMAANLDEACGGGANVTCNSALWCQKSEGQCKAADAAGTCEKAPTFCMRVSRPVCGCNGKTYANDPASGRERRCSSITPARVRRSRVLSPKQKRRRRKRKRPRSARTVPAWLERHSFLSDSIFGAALCHCLHTRVVIVFGLP